MEVKIEHLDKRFGRQKVLDDVCLTIPAGLYGLLGKNGAGKTTLMRILATVAEPSSGRVWINGLEIKNKKAVRRIIGYLPQEFSVYPGMRVSSALDYLGILAELPKSVREKRIPELLKQVNLDGERRKKFKNLSGGMKRRFGIAQALLNDPKILIVDEPTAGLDPEERIRFFNLLSELARDRIVLFSTHIAGDIEAVCSHAAILNRGRVIYQGSILKLLEMAEGNIYMAEVAPKEIAAFKQRFRIIHMHQEGARTVCRFLSEIPPGCICESCEPTIEDSYMFLLRKWEEDEKCCISEN